MNFLVVMKSEAAKNKPVRYLRRYRAYHQGYRCSQCRDKVFVKATRRLLSALLALLIFFSLFGNRDRAALPSDLRLNVVAGL